MSRSGWAPQPKVCWYCGAYPESKHRKNCVFEGVFTVESKNGELVKK